MSEKKYPQQADRKQIYTYKVDVILGEGGTGVVYRGINPADGTVVAIKLFRANFFRNRLHVRDLAKTAAKFKKLTHPNLVRIFDFIEGEEGEALVTEYVDGPDLKWYMQNRAWNLQERLVIVAQICNGLAFLHENSCVHHDLKPGNVLFTRKGQVKLCDYSLVGSTHLMGIFDKGLSEQITPMYVAPEIIKKEKATSLSDMYSLGVMLYLLFTEKVPYEVDTLQKLYWCHVNSEPIHPSLVDKRCPRPLGDIIMRLMSKKPERRYPDAHQVRIALAEIGKSRI